MHHPSPFDPDDLDDDQELGTPVYEGTGLTVRALTHEELDLFLDAHADEPARLLDAGWDQLPPPTPPAAGLPDPSGLVAPGWPTPVLADPTRTPRSGYGTPGRSAMATYRRERARELAAWARSLPWRATVVLAVAAGAAIVGSAVGFHGAARLLRRVARHGCTVFHDVAIPGTPANADHVLIGPAGVVLVDSKRYTGRVWQGPDGRVWHNQYPMDRPLSSLRMEAAAIAGLLGVPVRPLMCVHGANVDFAGLTAGDVEILPAGRLVNVLTAAGQRLSGADVRALVAQTHTMLRPA